MDKESADKNTKGWFELHMKASQNILNNMTEEEKKKLCKKGEEMGEEGPGGRWIVQESGNR